MIIDSHCHIDFEAFDKDRAEVLQRASSLDVKKIIVPGISADTWPRVKSICSKYSGLYPCYGLHPYFIDQHNDHHLEKLDHWLTQQECVALGECGLDFYLKQLDQSKQLRIFEAQLDLAKKHNLPVVVHSRKATEQVIQCIKPRKGIKGMIHSYSGSYEQAMQLVKLGFSLSFGGAVTYTGAIRLREMVSKLPLEAILIETDAPDQPDQKHHGLRNEPGYITQVVEQISQLKNISIKQLIDTTTQNAQQLFSI